MSPRPYLIGIAGPSCSGKSELACRLARRLGVDAADVVALDSYYRDLTVLDPRRRAACNFDHPDALDHELFLQHLEALSQGESIEVPRYDFASHTRVAGTRRVRPGAVAIVEGLHVLHWSRARRRLDLKIFIDAADELCLRRRIDRDVRRRGRTLKFVRDQFAATVRPMYERYVHPARRFADLVLDGAGPLEHSVDLAAAHVERSG